MSMFGLVWPYKEKLPRKELFDWGGEGGGGGEVEGGAMVHHMLEGGWGMSEWE
jgi:hypothetical protein